MSNDLREEVLNCLIEFMKREEKPSFKDASWIEDFGLDSLALFNFLLHIEERLGFSFSEDELNLANIQDFGDLVEMVHRRRSEPADGQST
jgi:acyl carrier protein